MDQVNQCDLVGRVCRALATEHHPVCVALITLNYSRQIWLSCNW